MLSQVFTSCCQIWQVHKIIAEDVNRPGEFKIPLQLFFMTQSGQLFTLQFSSSAYRKLMTRTVKNPQHGIREQMVSTETHKQTKNG